jgi:predicted negative regulator of RcsB-dependent stress response
MDKKLSMQTALEYLKVLANKLGTIIVIAAAMVIGFLIGYYYWYMSVKTSIQKKPKTLNTVSIALNDRSELMIIDRVNGVYTIYQDSVGLEIFNLYASQKYHQIVK